MPLFNARINPLKWLEIDPHYVQKVNPTAEQVLHYLLAPGLDRDCNSFVTRYREIDDVPTVPLFVVPDEENILQKLVWPLRHAKGSYALGNYLGCIALCGMVGEMVTILLWDISKVSLQGKAMDKATQEALFGRSFEKLEQRRRLQALLVLGLIGAEDTASFERLRQIRNRYLHLFSQGHAELATDARRAFEAALKLVALVLGQSFKDGTFILPPDLAAYLSERGVIEDEPQKDSGQKK
jgi:hypothetical protein